LKAIFALQHPEEKCGQSTFHKRQRMIKVMIPNSWIFDSGSRVDRVCSRLLTFGLLAILYGLLTAQSCGAQTADQVENQWSYPQTSQTQYEQANQTPDQQMGQTPYQQPCPTPYEGMDQNSYQQTGQSPYQQTGQLPYQQTSQSPYQQAGQSLYQQPCQTPYEEAGQTSYEQAGQASYPQTMSAEQVISILEQEPVILASIKNQVAQQTEVDPSTISDEALYERIRQDASLRDLATRELIRRGYSANLSALSANSPGQMNARSTGAARRRATSSFPPQAPPYQDPDNPQVQYRLSPYRNMPSLSALYSQFPVAKPKLRRFGSEAFLVGTGNANELPMDLPAGPDYVLGPGDGLIVNLWGGLSSRLSRFVDRQGQIELPEAGTIMVNGMTIAQAQDAAQKALDTQFQGEHVEISLGRLRTVRVYVVGDVQRPGAYDVSSLSTPLSALYAAGGPTSRGSMRILRQYRGKQLIRQVDLYDFLLRGVRSDDERLQPGDTILVPPVGPQVTVEGMVRRPAIYELNGEQELNQVLDLAGGVLASASLKQINVERIESHQSRSMFSLQLPDNKEEIQQKLAAFKIQDGDDVLISQIPPYNAQAVYLEGHVFHPGKYPYRDGMTINDLLHSYADVMPEPSDHAELIRLQPPDFRPETISFNLADVLIGNDSIPLHPFDLIRVYGRYEIDSPHVSIAGEVLRPGDYPMSQGMTVAGLVRMAGGFRRSAYRDEADLSSYVVQDGQKVMVNHSTVAVQKALDGDKAADVALKPGDVVSIRRLAGWQDIGASVTISGEVEHAGSYGIQDGERLSSVLKRAGGFRADAYPPAAVLERVQVRQLAEQARLQMIQRIENTPTEIKTGTMSTQTATDLQQSLQAQRQQILARLRSRPASGRMVINISSDISKWEDTPADIQLRAGDTLIVPKRPSFVMISGQVFNPVAISYLPGKDLGWYLRKAGGTTPSGNKKDIYVLRADGSVVPRGNGWMGSSYMDIHMRPGDTIFVPEKIVGTSQVWQNILGAAQIMSVAALPIAISGGF
jgi:protein involved in polysaccharide export with SLBB domain